MIQFALLLKFCSRESDGLLAPRSLPDIESRVTTSAPEKLNPPMIDEVRMALETYYYSGAPHELNLNSDLKARLLNFVRPSTKKTPDKVAHWGTTHPDIFLETEDAVLALMQYSSLPAFLDWALAQEKSTLRARFHFGIGGLSILTGLMVSFLVTMLITERWWRLFGAPPLFLGISLLTWPLYQSYLQKLQDTDEKHMFLSSGEKGLGRSERGLRTSFNWLGEQRNKQNSDGTIPSSQISDSHSSNQIRDKEGLVALFEYKRSSQPPVSGPNLEPHSITRRRHSHVEIEKGVQNPRTAELTIGKTHETHASTVDTRSLVRSADFAILACGCFSERC